MISTIGAFILALGVLVFVVDLFVRFRRDWETQRTQTNPWNAGTLEWLPSDLYSMRSVPIVDESLPSMGSAQSRRGRRGGGLLSAERRNRTARDDRHLAHRGPSRNICCEMPGPGWAHMFSAVFTAAFFLLLTVKAVAIALVCGAVAIFATLVWCWQLDPPPRGRGRDRRRDQSAHLYVRTLVARLVGDDRADSRRRLALHHLRLLLPLSLDRQPAGLARRGLFAASGPALGGERRVADASQHSCVQDGRPCASKARFDQPIGGAPDDRRRACASSPASG